MAQSNHTTRKYAISAALVTSLAFTPIFSGSVFANAGVGSSEGDITINESNIPNVRKTTVDEFSLIQLGDTGQAVEDLQATLHDKGYYTYTVDGIFGPITEKAVRDFQADKKLQVDGLVGPNTSEALALPASNPSGDLTITEAGNSNSTNIQSDIVATAESVIGTPYVWGGTTTKGMDSSGFINYVFKQVGIDVSRTHSEMWENDGVHVGAPNVGDVVFFEGTYDTEGASHSGVYIGNNQMIHAGNDGVRVADISIDYWQNHYIGAKSFIN
ncbi:MULTISPECIES: C40 family peptidase [Virgibacillus]|uniref:C40 family peptidase n=1 Tax=Virgibacillus TaxID=84406 RepID=UPI000417BBD4|nr:MULTISPECIES: NlpC/P60 family protein [Bacillaceae]MDY7046057.1 NlpC/P60 family protein [Virgibacillus sp. M23]